MDIVTAENMTMPVGNLTMLFITNKTGCWDPPANFDQFSDADKRFYKAIAEYRSIHGYLSTIICIVVFLTNLANAIVLSRKKMATSPVNFLMTIIAIAEMLLSVIYLPMTVIFFIIKYKPEMDPYFVEDEIDAKLLYFVRGFTILLHSIAVWHTIAVASFRWLTFSLVNGKQYLTMRNAKISSLVLVIANSLVSIPSWLDMHVKMYTDVICDPEKNSTIVMTLYTVTGKRNFDFNAYLYGSLSKVIPAALLTILTIPLIYQMRSAEQNRIKLLKRGNVEDSKRHREHNRTTAMLLAVVIVFLVIELPEGIFLLYARGNQRMELYSEFTRDIVDLLTIAAFTSNFILYTIMSRQFRKTFISIFCCNISNIRNHSSVRRVSTMLTSLRQTTSVQKRSNTCSNYSVNSINLKHETNDKTKERYLHPSATPLLNDDCTRNTSVVSDSQTANEVGVAMV